MVAETSLVSSATVAAHNAFLDDRASSVRSLRELSISPDVGPCSLACTFALGKMLRGVEDNCLPTAQVRDLLVQLTIFA